MSLNYQTNLLICSVHMPMFQLSLFRNFIKFSLSKIQIEYLSWPFGDVVMMQWCFDYPLLSPKLILIYNPALVRYILDQLDIINIICTTLFM
jgi:hypothetical protein